MIAAPNPTSTIAAGSGARTVRTARAASWSWRRNAAAAAMQAAARVNHRSGFSLRRRYSFSREIPDLGEGAGEPVPHEQVHPERDGRGRDRQLLTQGEGVLGGRVGRRPAALREQQRGVGGVRDPHRPRTVPPPSVVLEDLPHLPGLLHAPRTQRRAHQQLGRVETQVGVAGLLRRRWRPPTGRRRGSERPPASAPPAPARVPSRPDRRRTRRRPTLSPPRAVPRPPRRGLLPPGSGRRAAPDGGAARADGRPPDAAVAAVGDPRR